MKVSIKRAKELLSYSWKICVTNLLINGYDGIYDLVVGNSFSMTDLGFFNKGRRFPRRIVDAFDDPVRSVIFSLFSKRNNSGNTITETVRLSVQMGSFIVIPIMLLLALICSPLIALLLGEHWIPCVPYFQVFCIAFAFLPIQSASLQAINALGRSGTTLKLEIIKDILGVCVLCLTIYLTQDLYIATIGAAVVIILALFLNAVPTKKYLCYSYADQVKDILLPLSLSVVSLIVVFPYSFFIYNEFMLIIAQSLTGALVYFVLSYLFNRKSLNYLKTILHNMVAKSAEG